MWRASPGVVCAYSCVGHVTVRRLGTRGVVLLAGRVVLCAARPAVFRPTTRHPCLVRFCLPASAHCIVARMRDFMLCATCARLSVGAPGLVDGSVSARPSLGGATIGEGFVRGEYA